MEELGDLSTTELMQEPHLLLSGTRSHTSSQKCLYFKDDSMHDTGTVFTYISFLR